jgi:acyl-coenzyme A thioesterase PaaI-like protein
MSTSQQVVVTRGVLDLVRGLLGGPTRDGDEWCFDLGDHLHSNWGAVYGGALSAAMLTVARSATPERSPRSIHVQMVRSVPSGRVFTAASVRHAGRTVATVEVELFDQRRKLAAVALVTMVTPDAVATNYNCSTAAPAFRITEIPISATGGLPSASTASIIATLNLTPHGETGRLSAENVRSSVDGSAAAVMKCTIPWRDLEFTGPEAACLAADAVVAAPISFSYISSEDIGPNADLSLRFTTAPATRDIVAVGTMLSVQRGTAAVGIEVQAGDNQLAHGLATSLLLHRSSDGP